MLCEQNCLRQAKNCYTSNNEYEAMNMQPRKQHLINTALKLFNQHGYHATGIDLILAQSKVSKATLYKHFRSKDELILAVLEQRHNEVLLMLENGIEKAISNGSSGILAMFDTFDIWFNSDTFFGCNFINATAEYTNINDPINIISVKHKQAIVQLINNLLPIEDVEKANQLALLIDGAIVMAHTRGVKNSALIAKEMVKNIIH